MTNRSYGQFCGLARGLELAGERWALLIVRDLLVGPRRFTDLSRGLPKIPTNVLTARLKELESAGVVRRRALARPATGVVYELTEYGAELEDVVLRLSRWGAQSLGEPRPGEIRTPESMIMALRSTFRPEAAFGPSAAFELHLGEMVIHARVDAGALSVQEGALATGTADLVIETGPSLRALLSGELSPADAIATGAVRLTGPATLLDRFVDLFQIPVRPATVS